MNEQEIRNKIVDDFLYYCQGIPYIKCPMMKNNKCDICELNWYKDQLIQARMKIQEIEASGLHYVTKEEAEEIGG